MSITMQDPSPPKADSAHVSAPNSQNLHKSPVNDPAIAVGLALRWARTAIAQRGQGASMPETIVGLLHDHVAAGDPASALVTDWLTAKGLLSSAEGNGQ